MYDIIIGRDESDKKNFENKGVIYLGKGYVKMGRYTSLSNKIFMDIVRSHVILVAGKRGSGKSYTLGVIAEGLSDIEGEIKNNIAPIIFDTMGIYWTMKFENNKDRELMQEWELKPKSLNVKVFVPFGYYEEYIEKGIPIDEKFSLDVNEMDVEDWIITFNLDMINPISILIEKTINKLKKTKDSFNIEDIVYNLEKENSEINIKNAAINLFEGAKSWGIFSDQEKIRIEDLINPGTTSVIDLSVYNSIGTFNVRALVISLISRKIFKKRMEFRKKEEISSISQISSLRFNEEKKENPLIWIFIDEAHEFLPLKGKTPATDALVQLLREGRQPGISLVLATQQPGQIHKDVMTQSDIVISHRLTSKPDLDALNYIMQNYLLKGINDYMNELPKLKGSAIVLDDNSERIYPIRIKPRFTWHGGDSPTAIKT
jgi:hypothetical protein